jgi:hypothetical protein
MPDHMGISRAILPRDGIAYLPGIARYDMNIVMRNRDRGWIIEAEPRSTVFPNASSHHDGKYPNADCFDLPMDF